MEFWTVGSAAIVSAGLASALVLGWIRLDWPGWLLVCIGCLPVALLALLPDHRLISFHGFLHSGIAYRILASGVPPFDPLFAETPLLYPWAHHAIVAGFADATGVSPASVFVGVNLAALAGTLVTVHAICISLFRDRATAIFGSALALYGLAALPVAAVLGSFPSLELESRLIPIQKYASTNSNALGFLFYALGLLALIRLADRLDKPGTGSMLGLFGAVLAAAIFYPLSWAPLTGVALVWSALCAHLWNARRAAISTVAIVAAASLVALPYLMSVQFGKSAIATLGLDLSIAHGMRNGANLLLVAFGWAVLLAFGLARLRRAALERPAAFLALATAAIIPAALFLPAHAAVHSEYKFLALCGFTLAIPSAYVIRSIYDRSLVGCFLVLCVLFIPAGGFFAQLTRTDFRGDAAAVSEQGVLIVPGDEQERALTDWIRSETAADAVFVDTELSIPPFAHRQLYVAMDAAAGGERLTGWGLPPTTFLAEVIGHPIGAIEQRRGVTRALLSAPGSDEEIASALGDLRRDIPDAPLYLVARFGASRRLSSRPELERVFGIGPIQVFRVSAIP